MKIKNILALLCFLCIGVSCSMEDDILSGVDTKGPAGIDATELYALIRSLSPCKEFRMLLRKALNLLGQLTELRRI